MPWLAAAIVVALAAGGAWRLLRPRPATTPTAGDSAPAQAAAKPEAAPSQAPRQRVKPVAPPPAVAQTTPPPPVQTAAPAPPKREAAPAPAQTTSPAGIPIPAQAAARAPAPAPPPAVEHPLTPVSAPLPASVAAPAPAPTASDVPTIDDLPPDVRSALPPLPITMQVYSSDPKRRFVIIDGTRVVEGDSLRGVTVQEIRPAGVVLEFQGRRVLLPRPGS